RGSGDVAESVRPFADDLVQRSLTGVVVGVLAVAALGALFMTAEFRRGMIRTTFAASPGRGRVLAAKAIVLGGATFAAGLVPRVIRFLLSQGTPPPPRRGRVLAPKAIVLGGATFAAGLVASVIAFLVSQATLRHTSRDPGLPELS